MRHIFFMTKLIIYLSPIFIFALFYLNFPLLKENGYSLSSDSPFITGCFFIIILDIFLVALCGKSLLLKLGTLIIYFTMSMQISQFMSRYKSISHMELYYNLAYLFGLLLFLIGLSRIVGANSDMKNAYDEQYKKFTLYSEMFASVFYEYNTRTGKVHIEISDSFNRRHHLTYENLYITNEEYFTYIYKPDLLELIKQYNYALKHKASFTAKFQIKLPEMKNYILMSCSFAYIRNQLIGMEVDFTEYSKIQEEPETKMQKLPERTIEYQYIMEHTMDYVAILSSSGTIEAVSNSFAKFAILNFEELKGSNIKTVCEKLRVNSFWFNKTLLSPFSASGKSSIIFDNGVHQISWQANAVLNQNNQVDYVICIGHDNRS